MKHFSLFSKLFLAQVFLVLLATLIVGYLGKRGLEQVSFEDTEHSLQEQVFLFAELVRREKAALGSESFEQRLSAIGENSGNRYTIIHIGGKVLADSEVASRLMDDHSGRPEILEAIATNDSAIVVRRSATVGRNLMYLARPMALKSGQKVILRIAKPLASIEEGWRRLFMALVFGASVTLVVASLLGYWFSRRFTEPLRGMTTAARDIAAGNYERTVDAKSRDEIGDLGRALNSMTKQLGGRMETIATDRNKLLAILASMVEGVVAIDEKEQILHLNQVAASMLGVEKRPDGWIGTRVWELTRVREACEILSRSMEEKKELSEELVLPGLDSQRVLIFRACPIFDSVQAVAGAVLVIHDRTEESRFETVRRDFVANVSHELKTPLTAIRGYVETMVDDSQMPEETQRKFLSRMHDQVLRLGSLVTDLLSLSRLESSDEDQDFQRLDLRGIISESVLALSSRAEKKGLRLKVEIAEDALEIFGDQEAIRQLIDNLLSNAINYTDAGGWVRIHAELEDERILLEVEDSGVGIAAQDLDRVFERFFRVDKARSRELGGTGLGLAIVKHVARSHAGEVSVDSELGRGTCFQVRLPAARPSQST